MHLLKNATLNYSLWVITVFLLGSRYHVKWNGWTIITNTSTLRSIASSSGFTTEFITTPQTHTHLGIYRWLFYEELYRGLWNTFSVINHSLSVNINESNGLTDPQWPRPPCWMGLLDVWRTWEGTAVLAQRTVNNGVRRRWNPWCRLNLCLRFRVSWDAMESTAA